MASPIKGEGWECVLGPLWGRERSQLEVVGGREVLFSVSYHEF